MPSPIKTSSNGRVNQVQPETRQSEVISDLKRIHVKISGVPPGVLFQGKGLMDADPGGKSVKPRPPEEEARLRAHWTKAGGKPQLAIPWVMLYRSICKAGAKFKDKGKRTYESLLAPTISCEQDMIPLGTDQFETYCEYVKIPPRTGAMVKVGRPLLREWSCEFTIVADCETYNPENLDKIIAEAGKFVGIGAWRPQLKGPYGRFTVVEFEIE